MEIDEATCKLSLKKYSLNMNIYSQYLLPVETLLQHTEFVSEKMSNLFSHSCHFHHPDREFSRRTFPADGCLHRNVGVKIQKWRNQAALLRTAQGRNGVNQYFPDYMASDKIQKLHGSTLQINL